VRAGARGEQRGVPGAAGDVDHAFAALQPERRHRHLGGGGEALRRALVLAAIPIGHRLHPARGRAIRRATVHDPAMNRFRMCILAVVAAGAVAAGCGGDVTDVSQGVEELNKVLGQQGAKLECPDEVDGGEGATFDCTMKSTKGDVSAPVKMKIVKEEGELAVDRADDQQFRQALEKVTQQ
jgi:hypothetical protein